MPSKPSSGTTSATELHLPGLKAGNFVVFGGSGHLGSAIARILAQHGSGVYITYHSKADRAQALAASLSVAGARAVFTGRCDFTDHEEIRRTIADAAQRLGPLDGVVCSVGSQRRQSRTLATFAPAELDDMIATQFRGVIYCCREAADAMPGGGSIVLISSVVGSRGYIPGGTLHAALKAGVEGLVRHAAVELAPRSVRLNAVAPGYIDLGPDEPGEPDAIDLLKKAIPLPIPGQPGDVAAAVAFLLSTASKFTTGTVLHVDGGLFL